jgi:hypothetical protein
MRNTLYFSIFLGLMTLNSCQQKDSSDTKQTTDSVTNKKDTAANTTDPNASGIKSEPYSKKITIDYNKNKEILDILPLLPDSSMASWEWKKTERLELLQSVKTNNYYIDTTKDYNDILMVAPNYFQTQVVDGNWCVAVYKVSENNYIIITDDVVGDGNDLKAFELKNQQLTALPIKSLLGDYLNVFLIDSNNEKCKSLFEKNKFIVHSSYLKKKENESCVRGNKLKFVFNAELKKFELEKVTWQ